MTITRPITSGLAVALALAVVAAPGARAGVGENQTVTAIVAPQPVAVRVVRIADRSGFDWGDASIGAAGMAGLVAIGVGATLAAGGRRSRDSRRRPARVS